MPDTVTISKDLYDGLRQLVITYAREDIERNQSLRKVDPREFPRDPAPVRYTCRVYRIGDLEPFFLIYQDKHGRVNWWEQQIIIGDYFQCDPDDVGLRELDDGVEAITVRGNIVGSFTHPIELQQLLAESVK